jgi:4-amino-4-deoxy-L-arabinose transferase-like glycosyltransferase
MFLRKIVSEHKWLLVILFFACLLRLYGIRLGLPYQYHPDEVKYVILALKVGVVGPNIGYFDNPTGFVYLLFFEYGLFYFIGRLLSIFHSSRDLAMLYYQNPSIFFLLGRITSLLFSVGTVGLTYTIGKKSFNRTIGLLAALFLACSFGHIRDSHFAVPDISMVFFLMLSFYFIVRFWFAEKKPLKSIILAAGFAGVAIGFKYTAGLILVPLLIILILQRNKLGSTIKPQVCWFFSTLFFSFLGFIIVCPYAVIDYPKFLASVQFLQRLDETGYFGVNPAINGFAAYIQVLNWQVGTLVLITGITGIIYAIYQKRRTGLMLFLFPILYYLVMARSKLVFDRFMLPMLPFLVLGSAILIGEIFKNKLGWRIWISGIALLLILQPIANAVYCDYLFMQKDTRTLAKEWIEQYLPKGSKIVTEGYGPPLTRSRPYLKSQIPQDMIAEPYQVTELPKSGAGTYPIAYYREQEDHFLIISSFIYLRYWVRSDLYAEEIKFYLALPQEAKCIAMFTPYQPTANISYFRRLEIFPATEVFPRIRPGPVIQIYQIPIKSQIQNPNAKLNTNEKTKERKPEKQI